MTLRKLRRFLAIFLISLLGILVLVFATLNLPFSERFATRKVNQILSSANVPIHINAIKRILPNSVVIRGIRIDDLKRDTIIYVDELNTDIRLLALIRKKVFLEDLQLSQASVKILMNENTLKYSIAETFTAGRKVKTKTPDETRGNWLISILDGNLRSIHFQMTDSIRGIHILQEIGGIGLKNFSIPLADREIRAHTLELYNTAGYVSLVPRETEPKNKNGKPWNFGLLNLSMDNIDFTLDQDYGDLFMHLILGEGEIRARQMELLSRVVDIKSFSLKESRATVLRSHQASDQQSSRKPDQGIAPWFFQGKDIDLEEVDLRLGSSDKPGADSTGTKMDLLGLELKLKGFLLDQDHASLKLNRLSFELGNGFSMKKATGKLDSDSESTQLNLDMETGHSQLSMEGKANQSFSDIVSEPTEMQEANLAIRNGSLSLKDVYPFIQKWEEDRRITVLESMPYSLSGDIELLESILSFSGFSFSQDQNFKMSLVGKVANPFPISEASGEMKLGISEVDNAWLYEVLAGMGLERPLPELAELTIQSHVSNSVASPEFNVEMRSDLGSVFASGSLEFSTDSFSVHSSFDRIALGELLDLPELGSYTGSAKLSGQGFSRENFHSNLSAFVDSLTFKDYSYTRTSIEGIFQPGDYDMHIEARDTFLMGDLSVRLIPADSIFKVNASGTVSAQLNELNLLEDTLSVNTGLDASIIYRKNFFESELSASDIVLTNPYQSDEIKQIKASFKTDSVNTTIKATGDFFTLDMQVAKPFSEMDSLGADYRDYMATFTEPQHKNASTRVTLLPEINATSKITNHEALDIIMKDTGFHITNLDLSMQHYASENRTNYGLKGHGVSYKMAELDSIEVAIINSAGMMNVKVGLDDVSLFSGPKNDWFLNGNFANWRGVTSLSVHDPLGQIVYDLEVSARADSSRMVLEVPSKSLILNRELWQMETSDLLSVELSTQTISPALRMFTDSSFLHLYEFVEEGVPTFKLDLNQVEMESLVREDLFPGRPDASISGTVGLSFPGKWERRIESDLQLSQANYSDLKFDNISVTGFLEYDGSGNYSMDMDARLDSAEVNLKGLKTVDGERQIQSKVYQIPMNTLQPFTKKTLSELRGFISGEFDISNASGSDRVDGQLSFNGVRLKINALNSTFLIPDQALFVADEKLFLNKFRILDTLHNELLVDGFLDFQNVDQVNTDLNISSSNLQVMSRGSEDENTPFYGDVYVDSKFSVNGPLVNPSINGNILLSRGTEVFYRHMEDLSMSESQKILSFVSSKAPDDPSVSPVISRQGTFIKSSMETIVEIDPSTLINVSLSKRIYDLELQIQGGGKLNYNMLNNSQMSLSGSYDISDGSAELKLVGWPNKSFRIEEGGYIRWDGRVEDPELSFKALNRVSSSYQNPVDGNQRPVDFDVGLQLTDNLSDLEVLFTVNTSDQYLMSIINTLSPEEQMRQAISILLFEVIDLPGISSSSNYMSQQVNSILSSQLNQFSQSTIKGVDISFGLDTYTTVQSGGEKTSTSLSYEVRKSLMNDRAHIEVSGRLRDMNQSAGATNNALNNISLEYSLDSAATKFLKVYNEHTYEDVFEGEVIKTGIGFYVRKRHRHLRDIWKREKKDKKGKKERRVEE